MNTSKRYSVLAAAVAALFTVLTGLCAFLGIQSVKAADNEAILQIISAVREHDQKLDASTLARILNGGGDLESARETLAAAGIFEDDWINLKTQSRAVPVPLICAGSTLMCGAAATGVLLLFARRQKNENLKLAYELSLINKGDYNLDINENTEDDHSMLRNEIYKTTVMLREQRDREQRDKALLKESLSDISHQLKTPLTSMLITLDNLTYNEDIPDSLRREFLHDIRRGANSISFLVQSLLTLSKLDSNTLVLKSRPESLDEIFDECVKNTAILAELGNVEINYTPCNLRLNCDRRWLIEAISNIIKNCVEHTDPGGRVAIFAEENKLYTKITVSDNGRGISQKDLPHIFERFYRGGGSPDDSLGIGLALAKTIIEKNGGYITAASTPGKGTAFVIKYLATGKQN